MILFEPGSPTPPLHRRHPAVRELDRVIRYLQASVASHYAAFTRAEDRLQHVRAALVGKPLRPNNRTGARARQRRLL